jgi:hypothetical protein
VLDDDPPVIAHDMMRAKQLSAEGGGHGKQSEAST